MAKTLTLTASVSILALMIMGSVYVSHSNLSAAVGESRFDSVEIGVSELSPRGESGGYAIPASGSSQGCSLTLTPSSMVQGSGNVQLTWTPNMSMGVARNSTGLGMQSSGWTDSASSGLSPGTYTYSLYRSVDSGSCAYWAQEQDCDSKGSCTWKWVCQHNGTNDYSCQRNLTISAAASQCSDGIDNDGDGKVDYGGPNPDPGCSSAADNDETDPPQCSDALDNDGDGRVDYPNDPGCSSASDPDEFNAPLPAPSGSINATPSGVTTGGTTVIDWNTSDTISCTVTGNGDSWSGTSGSQTSSTFGSAGNYTYTLRCNGTDGSANVIVDIVNISVADAAFPNLVSGNIDLNSGTLQDGQTVTFRSTVDNAGGANTPASSPSFHDNFTYQWNGTGGAWQPIGGHIPHNMMTPADAVRTDTSVGLPLLQSGTLYIQHCVDSQGQVDESAAGETGNCVVSSPGFNVIAAPAALSITSCSASPSPATEGQLVTWQANVSGGVPPYSYSWSGTGGLSGSGNPKTITYATVGTKNAQVTVTDSASGSSGPFDCTALTVNYAEPTINFKVCDIGVTNINDPSCSSSKSVPTGTDVSLVWESDGDRCEEVQGPGFDTGAAQPADGNDAATPSGSADQYTIRCWNGTEANFTDVTVNTGAPPTINVDPKRVRTGEPFDIEWDTNGSAPADCSITGGGLSLNPISGNTSLDQTGTVSNQTIAGETTYTITCPFGSDSFTVELIPGVFES